MIYITAVMIVAIYSFRANKIATKTININPTTIANFLGASSASFGSNFRAFCIELESRYIGLNLENPNILIKKSMIKNSIIANRCEYKKSIKTATTIDVAIRFVMVSLFFSDMGQC